MVRSRLPADHRVLRTNRFSRINSRSLPHGWSLDSESEDKFHAENHAPDAATELLRLQESRIGGQHISLRRQGCSDTSVAENIAVAQSVVGVVKNVESLCSELQ